VEHYTKTLIDATRGITPADSIYKNAEIFNPFTCSFEQGTLAVKDGLVLGTGNYRGKKEFDLAGSYIVPGLIDAHVHIESSLLVPREYARLVALHGTTTVIADPHEIANVAGSAGIEFMLKERAGAAIDIQYMLPSCVPATPLDVGGATLDAEALSKFMGREGIIGLGEMMNVPGVLGIAPGIAEKLALLPIRDGHAPMLSGNDLNAYVFAGLQSDHESTGFDEAKEKLRRGMYLFIREGSTEQSIEELIPVVNARTVPRCCFSTDDLHADMLMDLGHIDHCIRKAVECGLEPELAIRMATLSPAERFGLSDRGALSPGRRADFCVFDDPAEFTVRKVFRAGLEIPPLSPAVTVPLPSTFHGTVPSAEEIKIAGSGTARVIGLVPDQIVTESLRYEVTPREIPDLHRDILKVVVCNRYRMTPCGVGLVHGFRLKRGAIASSISHDAHNVIAVGASDTEIRWAIEEVFRHEGAMAAIVGNTRIVLPLDCAGLMSTLPYPEVIHHMRLLHEATADRMEGVPHPFMYLSFLALTVIPAMRITDRGPFDAASFRDVPLFVE
jgi:adenine deaminase